MAASNIADRHAGLHRLCNNGQLQIGREAPPTGDASDHFDFRERSDIGVSLGLYLRSSGYRPCPVQERIPLSREGASGPVHFWLRRRVDEQ